LKKKLILFAAFAMAVVMVTGCQYDGAALKDGYSFGDLSQTYCTSTNADERDVARAILSVPVKAQTGFDVGVDYCAAFETIQDGYDLGDVTKVWCNSADANVRRNLLLAFGENLSADGVELSESYCGVAGYAVRQNK